MSQAARKKIEANEGDMRPEYDFSKGLRGVHAHRFSKLSSDEAFALGYWKSKGFDVCSFALRESPDGTV